MAERHKILYLVDTAKLGGAEKVLSLFLKHLDRDRFQPYVILGGDGPLRALLRELEIPHHVSPLREMRSLEWKIGGHCLVDPFALAENLWFFGRGAWGCRGEIDRIRPALVHVWTLQWKMIATIPVWRAGIPLVWHVHNIQPKGFRRRALAALADRFPRRSIVVSEAVRRSYLPVLKRPEKMVVVHNGLELGAFVRAGGEGRVAAAGAALRRDLGVSPDDPLVGTLSVLRPWKGQHGFVAAAARLAGRFARARFAIAGDEYFAKDRGYRRELERHVEREGLGERVLFLGHRDDVPAVLAALDLVVLPSERPDPLPTVVLEAMASGRAVVATAVGGVPEMVEHGVTGLLVPPGDEQALAGAVAELLADPGRREEMGKRGRARVESHFSVDAFVRRVEDIYGGILAER